MKKIPARASASQSARARVQDLNIFGIAFDDQARRAIIAADQPAPEMIDADNF